jgi:transcriptional regulator with AAA-type ATPase domain
MPWSFADRAAAADLATLTYANPFTPERLALEHRLLGLRPPAPGQGWHAQEGEDEERAAALAARAETLRLAADDGDDPALREAVSIYVLYERFRPRMELLLAAGSDASIAWWQDFAEAANDLLPQALPRAGLEHLLACLVQVRRSFAAIHAQLVGASAPMVALRAACWSSVFGVDLRRYRTCLWERMRDFPTLVTGPSGSGKELVAQAVGASAYIAVDGRRARLAGGGEQSFLPLAISALSPALVEAELFGHRRGAFTGAVEERAGWLEVCPAHGCVFLDELGEVEPSVQVKLLRVLQTRRFARVGEHAERTFRGRLVAATNRDLAAEITAGRFRADVYYRLCAGHIRTPALRELLDADPGELDRLCLASSRRIVGAEQAATVAGESAAWIRRALGDAYAWPGNVRELEQCVRSLLLRGSYEPAGQTASTWLGEAAAGTLNADALLDHYCASVAAQAGGWREAARRLGIDWRTVKLRAGRSSAGACAGPSGR